VRVPSDAIRTRRRIGDSPGARDAKAKAVPFYETLGFVALEGAREGLLVGEPLPMFLGIETIAATMTK
jgi:hypothetical protein